MKDFRRSSGQSAGRANGGGYEKREQGGGRERTNNFGEARPKYDTRPGQNKFQKNRFERPDIKHKAICSECHNQCEVPFKPNGSKPVYCADCFGKKKGAMPMPAAPERAPAPGHHSPVAHGHDLDTRELKAHMNAISAKLDHIISAMEKSVPQQAKIEKQIQNHAVAKKAVVSASKKTTKKTAPAKKPAAKAAPKKKK